jgi:hypothetical protein
VLIHKKVERLGARGAQAGRGETASDGSNPQYTGGGKLLWYVR